MRVLDLFSGIGGFSLGLERAGMRTVAFCEVDPFCRAVLRKHWPAIPCYEDVRTLTAERLAADGIAVDVVCGGFPCQDISVAGKGAGIDGERSGLWSEYARIIGELRPRYAIVENVAALLGRGLDRVLGDLSEIGYDAEWHCIPAAAVGAPHRRDRLWIVAYAERDQLRDQPRRGNGTRRASAPEPRHDGSARALADAERNGRLTRRSCDAAQEPQRRQPDRSCVNEDVADAISEGIGPRLARDLGSQLAAVERNSPFVSDADGAGCSQPIRASAPLSGRGTGEPSGSLGRGRHTWLIEPDVGRVAHGVPSRVDRLRSLGNAVVPQIPELIGRAIMNLEV